MDIVSNLGIISKYINIKFLFHGKVLRKTEKIMDIQKIIKILDLIENRSFSEVEIEQGGLRIKARKNFRRAVQKKETEPIEKQASAKTILEENDNQIIVRSPLVGTFYRAPSPGASSFVEVGDRVKKGQVLCIIEAMKLMNEVEAESEGKIVSIFIENAQPVEYAEPLFLIET